MSATPATGSRNRARPVPPPVVRPDVVQWTSRRGLTAAMYYAACERCQRRRAFTRLGERVCPCGARLRLVVTAEVA